MDMLKMNDTSTAGRLSKGHLQLRIERDDEDCHHATNSALLPEVNFNARDEFNLKFFDNADDNCFSDSESVESCEASTSSPTDAVPCASIEDTESPEDWMDSLMQTIDGVENYATHKTENAVIFRAAQNNNNEGEDVDQVLTDCNDRTSDIFTNVIKNG